MTNLSPGREYSNKFLSENLSKLLFNKEIKMLDIGCGSGYVREILYNLGYKVFYTGVDIRKHKDFEQFNKYALESDFIQSKIEDFNTSNKYDFVFSISALEHIKDDKLAVSKALQFLKPSGIQIHIVPSYWSLFLYLRHGYRRYTPSRLKKLFKNNNLEIHKLGGFFSFILHFSFITAPEILLGITKMRKLEIYSRLVNIANKLDYFFYIFPSFYVAIIKKNSRELD